jgi:hypothetical protein
VADLVSAADMLNYLDEPDANLGELDLLLLGLEARFEAECGRAATPFQSAQTNFWEMHDGTGLTTLWLNYPITQIKTVTIGLDPADPSLVVDITDPDVTVETAGTRKTLLLNGTRVLMYQIGAGTLYRLDGGRFGTQGMPGEVQIVYDSQADLPYDATMAIKVEAARLYRLRGSEDVSSISVAMFSETLANKRADEATSLEWRQAVAAHRRYVVA